MMQVVYGFILKEMRQTLRDPRMRVLLFVAPCIQMTLFGLALSTETRNIRLTVATSAYDPDLDDIRNRALVSGWFIDAHKDGAADPFALIRADQTDAVLVPPPGGLTHAIGRGDGRVQLLIDASNVMRAQGINAYFMSIVQEKNRADFQHGSMIESAILPPFNFDVRILYNPTLRSAVYMVPGVMSVITCLITILLTSMSIAREKEVGTFETILAAPVRSIEVIMGKSLPYVVLGIANLPLILAVAIFLFDVPMRGSFFVLFVSSLVFICATVAIGILISTITRTQQQAMMGGFLYLLPSLLISGLISPIATMPLPLQVLAYLNPVTYYMELLRNIMLKGGDPSLVLRNLLIMAAMAIVLAFFSVRRFRTTL